MSEPLVTGAFKIVSLIEDGPATGLAAYEPASQTVRLNQVVQIWKLIQDWAHRQIYWLAIDGYPYTGVLEEKVIATAVAKQDLKWHITYREAQDAYTIELDNDRGKGWTVSSGLPHPTIVVAPIKSTSTVSPQFPPSQLFRFVKLPVSKL